MGGYVAPLHPSIAGVQPLLPTRPARRRPMCNLMCNLLVLRTLQLTHPQAQGLHIRITVLLTSSRPVHPSYHHDVRRRPSPCRVISPPGALRNPSNVNPTRAHTLTLTPVSRVCYVSAVLLGGKIFSGSHSPEMCSHTVTPNHRHPSPPYCTQR